MTWIQSRTGKVLDVLDPDPGQITIDDMAESLARIPRYNAHTITDHTVSVAEHSVYVLNELAHHPDVTSDGIHGPWLALAGGLHDGHEYVMGDWPGPVTFALSKSAQDEIDAMKARLDKAICRALCPLWPGLPALLRHPAVRDVDLRALNSERKVVMCTPPRPWQTEKYGELRNVQLSDERGGPGWDPDTAARRWKTGVQGLIYRLRMTEARRG